MALVALYHAYVVLEYGPWGRSLLTVKNDRLSNQKSQLGGLLRQLREQAGLRQIDVAQKLGEGQSFVSKYESGERRLDLLELRRVSRALGISLIDLVERFERTV